MKCFISVTASGMLLLVLTSTCSVFESISKSFSAIGNAFICDAPAIMELVEGACVTLSTSHLRSKVEQSASLLFVNYSVESY